jgi:Domain of unknown function (DUF4430)
MAYRRSLPLASLLTLALVLPTATAAAPTAVDVRIEGGSATIFDGPVTTDGKSVTTASGGTHVCDGTNNGVSPVPAANATSALDDAAIKGGFAWDGTWSGPGYPDYFVTSIAGESQTASEFWGVFVNGVATVAGGCQSLIAAGDEVLWAFDAFNKSGALRLAAPNATRPGVPIVATATRVDGGAPVAGATVGSATTGPDGTASLSFADPGIYVLKAERSDLVRSRGVRVCVDPPGADECTSGDTAAPSVRLDAPQLASDLSRFGSRVPLSWQGDDAAGSGVKRYRIEVRHVGEPDSAWRLLRSDTATTKGQLNGAAGIAYELRVRAWDRANHASPFALATTIVPLDNLSNRLRFSKRGWKVLGRQGAWQLSTTRATARGASMALRFEGTGATLITRKLRGGGKLRLTVDGRSRTVSLRGRSGLRKTLVRTPPLDAGTHTLKVASLSAKPVEIDAVAVRP